MRTAICLLFIFALPALAQSLPATIELGTKLTLGEPQKEVLDAVGKTYEVKPLSDPSEFVVYSRPKNSDKPKWEGMLTFKGGKLVSAERLWAYENDDNSVALAKSLLGVLAIAMKDGHSTCQVQRLVSDSPDAEGESVFLNCGKRTIKISVAKVGHYKEDVSVSEILEDQ